MKTAKEYLLDIGFDEAHFPELWNDDDKSYYKISDLMESYATQAKGGGMTSDRIKEIQEETAYPESVSVYHALHKVWNECAQAKGGSGIDLDELQAKIDKTLDEHPPVTPQDVKQHKGYHMSDGDTSSTPPVTPQDDEKQNVFSRDECIFTYCPHPEECKDVCQCTADDLNKKIEKNNKVIEKMRDLSNIDMNAPYGATQQPTPSTHSDEVEADLTGMLERDNLKLKKAGYKLVEAATYVVENYDGIHRLSLAISEWYSSIGNQGDRDTITHSEVGEDSVIKEMAVKFFYWWYNRDGSNTEQGFDKWWKEVGEQEYKISLLSTPTKPIEITEEERELEEVLIELNVNYIEWDEKELAKAILTKLNGEK